jgi:hypothetical protein
MCLSKLSRADTGNHGAIDLNIAAREPGFALKYGSRDTRGYCNPPVDFDRANERCRASVARCNGLSRIVHGVQA